VAFNARQAFFDQTVILAVTQVLEYLAGLGSRVTQVGILRHPLFGLSEGFIDHIVKNAGADLFTHHTLDLFAAGRDREVWHRLLTQLKRWREAATHLTPAELAGLIAAEAGEFTAGEWRLIAELQMLLKGWEKLGLTTLATIVPALNVARRGSGRVCEPFGAAAQGIRLLTVHGAKGLEFDHVIVVPSGGSGSDATAFVQEEGTGFLFTQGDRTGPGLSPQPAETPEFTAALARLKADRDAEQARLIYVALTRARHRLYLFPGVPGSTFLKAIEKDPDNTDVIRGFDQWLYWLSGRARDGVRPLALPESLGPAVSLATAEDPPKTGVPADAAAAPPATITVTELETFLHCPRRFQLRYLQGRAGLLAARQVRRRRGQCLHRQDERSLQALPGLHRRKAESRPAPERAQVQPGESRNGGPGFSEEAGSIATRASACSR
jgi:ATP-dependent exoDNAse (exonuclease V) beta subunit